MWFAWIIVLLLSIILPSVTTLPVVFVVLLCLLVVTKKSWVFPLALISGLLIDLSSLNSVGKTSLFFILSMFIVLLYDKKFEIQTLPFVLLSSFIGSTIYLMVFNYGNIFFQSLVSALLAVLLFKLLSKNLKSKSQKYN